MRGSRVKGPLLFWSEGVARTEEQQRAANSAGVWLHAWTGNQTDENAWWPSSQSTSSQLLPDGSIITAFGTGYRIRTDEQAPRDVGLVRWRLNTGPVNSDTTIRDAAIDSDLRNVFDPLPGSTR